MAAMTTFEVTRTRMVTEVCTVEARGTAEAERKATNGPADCWRVREEEVLVVNVCEVPA